jgi:hypothetical protein
VSRTSPATVFAILCLAAISAAAANSAAPEPVPTLLQPYTARYQASYRGISGGEIEVSFHRGKEPGQFQYETRAFPNLLGMLAVSTAAHELGKMVVTTSGVKPTAFSFDDGSDSGKKDVKLVYDWTAGKVTGIAGEKPVDLALVPGSQDTASVQAAMIQERLSGRKPQSFRIITGSKVHDYKYWMEGIQKVDTPFGKLDAEVWANQRDGSSRLSKVWHAPSLGYVPVKAVQYRKGKAEVEMTLVKLKRGE